MAELGGLSQHRSPQAVMAERFYETGPARADKVRALFGRIAAHYDLINDLQSFGLHRVWKRRLVQLANPTHSGGLALDICCGTGDLTLALARQGMAVTGLDFTAEMLAVARARAQKFQMQTETRLLDASAVSPKTGHADQSQTGISHATLISVEPGKVLFLQGDALALPFEANTFDAVTVGYGLRNLADWQAGLREMQRVAKPGGRLLVLDFGKPENALVRKLYFAYLKLIVPLFGLVFCGSAGAYSYILESLKHYPAQQGVAAAMRDLRMSKVQIVSILGGTMSINYGEKRTTD